eukprot:TRINITY_DN46873_c0_g1_i1.p1 TRINITY_DN46873_c0_g1~~TRINITY_DN46873_c0_g1_i1.p1  ORF type:complete len:327 (+),score=120.10 TRINITY_DN46873_c0_g1_i1:69-983(+)
MPLSLGFAPRYCELEERGRLLIVRLNRPKQMNSQPPAMHAEMSVVWDAYERDPELWVAIVTGNGRAFSAGYDLKAAAGLAAKEDMDSSRYQQFEPSKSGFCGLTERAGSKPIIAAVNGVAHGGGFETALACDVIIASEKADFSLPEPKVGLFAAAGGVVRLPRLIGYHNAMSLILTGRRVSGKEALSLGIVQQCVPHDQLMPAAVKLADQILACSPDSIAASLAVAKGTCRNVKGDNTDEITATRTQWNYSAARRQRVSVNQREGPKAFAEKRAPKWVSPEPLSKFPAGTGSGESGVLPTPSKL